MIRFFDRVERERMRYTEAKTHNYKKRTWENTKRQQQLHQQHKYLAINMNNKNILNTMITIRMRIRKRESDIEKER